MNALAAAVESTTRNLYVDLSTEAQRVRDALIEAGLETPMIETGLTRDEKYDRIKASMTDVVETLGLDLTDDSLCEMVKVSDISVISTCEHHFVTIDGQSSVAYIPNDKIVGLSKINRIVRFFAQRPQVQERLTQQVLLALQTLLETDDVAVRIDATHYCVKSRGVMDANSQTQTTALGGRFKSDSIIRSEFLA